MTTDTLTQDEVEIKVPNLWKVILHNDDRTTMEFVIQVLIDVFYHSQSTAYNLMLEIHHKGSGVAGVYTHEIAEDKAGFTVTAAQAFGFPLKATIEEDI